MGKKLIVFCIVAASFLIGPAIVRSADKTPEQLVAEAKAAVREVTIEDVKKMSDNREKVIILDVREKDEFRQGHLPGAINMLRGLVDLHVHEIIPRQGGEDRAVLNLRQAVAVGDPVAERARLSECRKHERRPHGMERGRLSGREILDGAPPSRSGGPIPVNGGDDEKAHHHPLGERPDGQR